MERKRLLGLTLAVVLSFGMLVGCRPGSEKNGGAKNDDDVESVVDDGEILLWSSATGPDGEAIKKTIDNYNATNPDFKVKFVSMDAETFNAKLTTAGKSGKGVPDLALVASEGLPTYCVQDMLETWDDAIAGTEVIRENYISGAWDAGTVDGHQYGIPATMGSWIMYVNKTLADQYAPGCLDDGFVTYEEIEAAAEVAKADNVYSLANTWSMQNYMNIYLQMGGEWLDSEGKISIDNEYSKRALEEYKKYNDNGWLVPIGEDPVKLFLNSELIFLPEGTWMLNTMSGITDFEWVEIFTPQWDLQNIVQCAGADQFAIFKSAEGRTDAKKAGMVDFLSWLQGNQLEWCSSGAIPGAVAMTKSEEFLSLPQSFLLTSETGKDRVRINTTEGTSYVFSEVDARMWDMITGTADISETFAEIQKIVDEKMK